MKIAIITFAGERLGYGTGHVMETLTIADEWKNQQSINFHFFINDFSPAITLIKQSGYPVSIYTEISYEKKPFQTLPAMIRKWSSDANLISLPALFYEELKNLVAKISSIIVILDNDENQIVNSDVLINYNIAQDENFYKDKNDLNCFIGPDYIPLNQKRLERAITLESHKFRKGDIVVNLGDTNPNRLALKVLKALTATNLDLSISLVLGSGTPLEMIREIQEWLSKEKISCNLYNSLPQLEFYTLLYQSSAVISAPGNTLYEILYLGIPTAAIAENELTFRVASKFDEHGLSCNLGMGADHTINILTEKLKTFLNTMNQYKQKVSIFDGRGIERIIDISMGITSSK